VQWWADQCICGGEFENCRTTGLRDQEPDEHRENGDLPGVDLMEDGVAPETPPDATLEAIYLIQKVEAMNDLEVHEMVRDGDTPEDFGFRLAMEALGHGVGLCDDDPGYSWIKVPDIEYYQ